MHRQRLRVLLVITAIIPLLAVPGSAQETIGVSERRFVVETTAELLVEHYVFPDVGQRCADLIRSRLANGAYDDVIDAAEFSEMLTADLRSVSNDGHMNVNLYPAGAINEPDPAALEEARQQELLASKRDNFAFRRLEWLPGNVGLLEFRSFRHTRDAGPTAVAAMNFLAHSDAIIIDLRSNGGGDPTMIQLLSSYFFSDPVHLNSFERRGGEQVEQRWTLPHVPGPRMVDKPLFILVGSYTYSAAEEFAYNLQALGRATIVGETTGGGAHPTRNYRINETFAASIPYARALNPITGTNWEGTGIKPDIEVEAEGYMAGRQVAHLAALRAIEAELDDDWYRDSIRTLVEKIDADIHNAGREANE